MKTGREKKKGFDYHGLSVPCFALISKLTRAVLELLLFLRAAVRGPESMSNFTILSSLLQVPFRGQCDKSSWRKNLPFPCVCGQDYKY